MTTARFPQRMGGIDALRGIAALAVVLFHYTSRYDDIFGHEGRRFLFFEDGHLGVNLFFMISGFVILMTLERTRSPLDFAVSRFSRLFPAYWAAIVITAAAVAMVGLPGREVSLGAALANFSMVHNLFGVPHVDGVYWTLEIEILFYCWALLAFCCGYLSRVHVLFAGLLAARLVYFWCHRYLGIELPGLPYRLLILQYIPWFAAGTMIYRLSGDHPSPRRDLAILGAAIAVMMVAEGYRMAAIMLVFSALLFGAARGKLPLNHPWMLWLGAVSYTWYLVHQNIGYALIRKT